MAGLDGAFGQDLVDSMPMLRRYAWRLCGNGPEAADLVQETLYRAWLHHDSFTAGSNLAAWLCSILRNQFYEGCRKRAREELGAEIERASPADLQDWHMAALDVKRVIDRMRPAHRAALLTVGAGCSHEEAAGLGHMAVGTSKSGLSRARAILRRQVDSEMLFEHGSPLP